MQRLGRKCFLTKDIMFIPSLSLQFQVTPEKNGISTIMEKILSEKKAGGCRCAEKNPKGR